MDELRILIKTELEKVTWKNINDQLAELKKKYETSGIDIKINIDQNILKTLSDFNKNITQITQATQVQSNAIKNTTDNINKETQAINAATEAQKKWNVEKQKTIVDKDSKNPISTTSIYGNNLNNDKQVVTRLPDNTIKGNIINTSNMKKDLEDAIKAEKTILDEAYKMNESFDKQAEALDKAHYQALKTNQDRIEAQDKMHYMALKQNREIDLKEQQTFQKQAEVIDKAHYQALQTDQARTDAQDKQHYLALQQNQKREADFLKLKTDTITKITDMNRRFGSDTNVKSQLDDLQIKTSAIKSVGDYKQAIGGIQSELKLIGAAAQTSGSHVMSMSEQFGVAISRLTTWGLATTAIYGTKKVITEMIGTIVELNTQMVQLIRVMDSNTNFEQMMKGSIAIANQLGQKVTDINKALIEAAQAGFKAQQALDITKTSVVASNVSDMTPEESMNNLISAMNAFNITAQNSITIVDKLNEVDNNYSITTKNLADAVAHAGAAATTYGVTLDQLIGYTTAIGAVTRESGNVIGNMEKTVFSRIFTKSSADALAQVGISIADINGENRKASDIMDDIGSKWKTLSATQQQHLAVVEAGRNQLTRYLALFNNWDMAIAATNTSMNSQGSAMRENQKYMESLQAKINLLSTAWEQLSNGIGGKGLTGLFGGTIQTLTTLTKGFTDLTNATDGWNIKLPILAAGLYGLVKAFQAVRIAAEGAKLSMGWIGVGLIAIDLIASAFIGASKNTEINTQALLDNANQTKSNTDQLQGLIDKYNKLEPEAKNSAVKQQELHDVLKQINDIAPQVIDNTNKYGDALTLNKEKANAYIASLKQMTQEQLSQAKLANGIQLNKVSADLEAANSKLKSFGDKVKNDFSQLDIFQNLFQAKTIDKGLENYRNTVTELQKQQDQALQNNDSVSFGKISQQIGDLHEKFRQFADLAQSSQKELANYSQTVNDRNGLEQQKKALDEQSKSIIDQIEGRKTLTNEIDNNKIKIDEETGEVIKAVGFQEVLSNKFAETVQNIIQPLNDAIDKLKQGHQLTSGEITSLLKQYPDLFTAFTTENGLLQINIQALEDKRQKEIDGLQTSIKAQQDAVKAQEEALRSKLKMFGIEIQAIESVSDAQKAADSAKKQANYLNNDDNTAANRQDALGAVIDIDSKLEGIAKAKESLNALQSAAQNGFKFENSLNTPSSSKTDTQTSLHTPTDFTNEEINNIKEIVKQRDLNIKSLEKQSQSAEKLKDYNKETELTNQLLAEQKGKIDDINTANKHLTEQADIVRNSQKEIGDQFAENGVLFDSWFNNSGDASDKYIQTIRDIETSISNIEGDGKNLTKQQQDDIKVQENKKKLYDDIFKQIQSFKKAWQDNSNSIDQVNTSIDTLNDKLTTTNKAIFDERQKLAKETVDLIKKTYETEKQAVLSNLDDEQKAFDEATQKKIDAIDQLRAAQDYNANLSKDQTKAQQIQNEINAYSLDNSPEAQSKVIELKQQLADQQDKIDKEQRDNSDKLVKQDLENKKKAYDQDVKNQKDAVTTKYDNLINDDQKYLAMENDIISGHVTDVQNTMKGLIDGLGTYATNSLGQVSKYAAQIKSTIVALNTSNTALGTVTPMNAGNYGNQTSSEQQIINTMKANSKAWDSSTDANARQRLHDDNARLGTQIGATYKDGTWYKADLPLYHNGGEVGVKGTSFNKWLNGLDVPAILKKSEVVMDNPMQNIASIISKFTPDFSKIMPKMAGVGGNTFNVNLGGITVTGDRKGGETVLSTVVNGLKRYGINSIQ